jgi:pimeloyl-ACP methyl ester carboxylesterase
MQPLNAPEAAPAAEESMESLLAPDGTRIAYQRAGDGPPLVLVHGTADTHTLWSALLPTLAERFTVYALDRRGRGGSDAYDAATYAIDDEFADVAAVVDAVGEPTHLLGHSYGALCSLEAALRTDNLRTLVLYEPPILIGEPFVGPEAVTRLEALLAAGDREGVLLTFAREFAQLPEEAIAAFRAMPEWPASVETAPTIVAEVRAVRDYRFDPARFRELTTPTLLLLGSESPPYLQTATEAVAAALPQDRLTILAGQGHLAMYTAPDRFLEEVVGFLNEG